MKRRAALTALIAVGGFGCESSPIAPVTGAHVQLSAQQATTLASRIGQVVASNPELGWLADSISFVIKAGALVDSVGLVTSLGSGPFYAVGLQRAISTSSSSSTTFDAILFNNPSDPTDFLIVGGWTQTASAQPAISVTGSFASPLANSGVTAHLFHIASGAVTAWRATSGTATFVTAVGGPPCPSFSGPQGASCSLTGMAAGFTISAARVTDPAPADARAASLSYVELPGIRLRVLVP
jgi:hypothetical protein